MQINHCSALEIAGFRTEAEDIDTPPFVSDWRWRGGGNIWIAPIATRSRKMRAWKIRVIDAIAIYLQHLKAEAAQLLECKDIKSDYCRRAGYLGSEAISRALPLKPDVR